MSITITEKKVSDLGWGILLYNSKTDKYYIEFPNGSKTLEFNHFNQDGNIVATHNNDGGSRLYSLIDYKHSPLFDDLYVRNSNHYQLNCKDGTFYLMTLSFVSTNRLSKGTRVVVRKDHIKYYKEERLKL